jgi:F-type H+-transporting ATPase subunit gamma
MAENKQAIKARIKSINATMKITSAMKLIANAKLAKQRKAMEKNKEYARVLKETVQEIISNNPNSENKYLVKKLSDQAITIIFCSDLGLCGGYNINMMKLAQQNLDKKDPVILIGNKQRSWLENRGYNIINKPMGSDNITYLEMKELVDMAINYYDSDEVSKIQVIYTEFVNTVTFESRLISLIPSDVDEDVVESDEKAYVETEFEPSADVILNYLIPMMIVNVTYSLWMQTKTAEQGTRRIAMENATDNAQDLNDKLLLRYNKARQSAITQEITEIVSGADAT